MDWWMDGWALRKLMNIITLKDTAVLQFFAIGQVQPCRLPRHVLATVSDALKLLLYMVSIIETWWHQDVGMENVLVFLFCYAPFSRDIRNWVTVYIYIYTPKVGRIVWPCHFKAGYPGPIAQPISRSCWFPTSPNSLGVIYSWPISIAQGLVVFDGALCGWWSWQCGFTLYGHLYEHGHCYHCWLWHRA